MPTFPEDDASRGIYGISVAAELVGTGPQNLRAYERHGLVDPERTEGGTRRYSSADLDRLRRIGELLAAGLNLAGIAAVLDLEATNDRLRAELAIRNHGDDATPDAKSAPQDEVERAADSRCGARPVESVRARASLVKSEVRRRSPFRPEQPLTKVSSSR